MKELPEIIKESMVMELGDQLSLTLFPKDGQPDIDVIKLEAIQIEGDKAHIYMTPCEAAEIASGLMSAVQFYLYNQNEYREKFLKPRLKLAEERIAAVGFRSKGIIAHLIRKLSSIWKRGNS